MLLNIWAQIRVRTSTILIWGSPCFKDVQNGAIFNNWNFNSQSQYNFCDHEYIRILAACSRATSVLQLMDVLLVVYVTYIYDVTHEKTSSGIQQMILIIASRVST